MVLPFNACAGSAISHAFVPSCPCRPLAPLPVLLQTVLPGTTLAAFPSRWPPTCAAPPCPALDPARKRGWFLTVCTHLAGWLHQPLKTVQQLVRTHSSSYCSSIFDLCQALVICQLCMAPFARMAATHRHAACLVSGYTPCSPGVAAAFGFLPCHAPHRHAAAHITALRCVALPWLCCITSNIHMWFWCALQARPSRPEGFFGVPEFQSRASRMAAVLYHLELGRPNQYSKLSYAYPYNHTQKLAEPLSTNNHVHAAAGQDHWVG